MTRAVPLAIIALAAFGCSPPNAANIALRKQVQQQADEITGLQRQHAADVADHAAAGRPATAPALSAGSAESLFTVHGIRLGKLTRVVASGPVVHVVPFDDDGDDFKAAGTIDVDAYDLTDAGRRVGHWAFDAAATRKLWNGSGLRYEYVVPCPWPALPAGVKDLTLKVTFTDALTGRSFDAQQELSVRPE